MQVSVSFDIDCAASTAWDALHQIATIASVYGPVMTMRSQERLPETLQSGDRLEVQLRVLGMLPVGRQLIAISDTYDGHGVDRVRTMHDRGGPIRGPLILARKWHHQISLATKPGTPNQTTWTDTLSFTGSFSWLMKPVLWVVWQLRASRIRQLARSW